jgi:hypothetical protein
MSGDKSIFAVFYIPKEEVSLTLADLLRRTFPALVVSGDGRLEPEMKNVPVVWAGMICDAAIVEVEWHYRFSIEFFDSYFYNKLPDTHDPVALENDPLMPLAVAFRMTCELLDAEVAMIITRNYLYSDEALDARYWMVLTQFSLGLVDEHYGLLFLRQDLCSGVDMKLLAEEHDVLTSSCGCLIFSGKAEPYSRWF